MDTTYKVNIEVTVVPTYHDSLPKIRYGINDPLHQIELKEPTVIKMQENLPVGKHFFVLDFYNKTDSDHIADKGLDKFLTITDVKIGGLSIPKFIWISEYSPQYPEPWYSEQIKKPPQTQFGADRLGFNGTWKIPFESPVFPWIHQLENMGWIWPT